MKKKFFAKKLVLKKETIAALSSTEMDRLHGGDIITKYLSCTCVLCFPPTT